MSDARHRLRILHISDLHARSLAGPNPEKEPARRYRVLADAWERNLAEVLQDGPVDLVCFTGDAADWGLPEEYEAASRFFEELLRRLGVSRDRLFIIPGNHDIQRKVREDVWRAFRERAPRADGLELARWMAGIARQPPPLGFEDDWRDQILERQAGYRAWVRDGLVRSELDPERSAHGRLGYRVSLDLPGLTFPIHVIGLDTSWLCGNDADANHLRLTDSQVLSLASGTDGKPLPGLRLALLHHPFHELADGAHCRKLVSDSTDISLRGHLHRTEVQAGVFPDQQPRIFASGCLFEGDRADLWGNACQVLTLSLDDQGLPDRLDLRFRAFSSDGGHWYDDGSLYEKASSGKLSWTFTRAVQSSLLNLYDPWTPAVPPRFVGREDLLRRLEAALEEKRSVSVVGDWRIGKSSLLQTWYEKQKGSGREVQLLSGEGPEGVSPRAFVEKVSGWRSGESADEAADILDRWAGSVGRPGLVPLVLVDELDGMIPRFEHRFLERLRGMLGRIVLVLASRRELDLIYEDLGRTSPFHNRLELMWVGLLDKAAAEALIASGEGILPDGAELMRLWAGRHPFYLQLLGRCLQDASQASEISASALDRFRSEAATRLRELWRILGERDRNGLLGVLSGKSADRRTLRTQGLATEEGKVFGKVLEDWLREEL